MGDQRTISDGQTNILTSVATSNGNTQARAPHREGNVVLRDGSTVRIRVMRPADEPGLLALLQSLSEESRWLRFYSFASNSALAIEAHREANLDHTFGL